MREFDSWNSYLDNDGNPLHGKIRFCRRATTDNIAITDADGVALPNPMPTDILGRTASQVFFGTGENVSAYFYKYVGSGEWDRWPPEDYDPERWSLQYEVSSVDPVDRLDLDVEGAPGVNTMADLRSLDPAMSPMVDGVKLIWLYGYYNAGDTSPVLYMWDRSCNEADDGGACIRANSVPGMGRWVLVSRELHFDVRHFGIFPTSDMYSTDTSYTSQIANCAPYLDRVGSDAWFPAIKSELSWYLFDGSNTFSIRGDIFISDSVRFQCKTGTTGTVISCHEVHKGTPGLFVSSVNTGTGTLRADWVNISWVGGNVTGDARVGWVIDSAEYPRTITGKEVKFITNGSPSLQLDNCLITSNKKITGQIVIRNSVLHTDFFADDYSWGLLTSVGNRILLENCKDANTYILLKNKQNESDYGDLGEQAVSAAVLAGGTIENCSGRVTFTTHGATEMHNVSLVVSGLTSADSLNLVDSWISFEGNPVLSSLHLRRGSLAGASLQVLGNSLIDSADIDCPVNSLGTKLVIRNSCIHAPVTAQDIDLLNNQVYAEVSQVDNAGFINVNCVGNMFYLDDNDAPARHYVHATTPGTIVRGTWAKNGSAYDTAHWIRLDRTNLEPEDRSHQYTYTGNCEPYLMKWSGRCHPMTFRKWSGYRVDSSQGEGVWSTTDQPFIFFNTRTRKLTAVNRQIYWKMFTVGRGFLMRSGRIMSKPGVFGLLEGDYSDYRCGDVPIVWCWGCNYRKMENGSQEEITGYPLCVSLDGDGEAEYNVSFEASDEDHTQSSFSQGVELGYYPSTDWGDAHPQEANWPIYPSDSPVTMTIFVMIDPDFSTANNPAGYT